MRSNELSYNSSAVGSSSVTPEAKEGNRSDVNNCYDGGSHDPVKTKMLDMQIENRFL